MNNSQQSNGEYSNIQKTTEIIDRIANGGHLHRIREALEQGHAAVMIGSGFSLNAENGNRLTLWDGLIDSLISDLYKSEDGRKAAKRRLGGTSGMLRLAEEYAAVLGRAQLDKRLHALLPDAGITMPGELHKKLLSLNWADVYTTNYDTLLERALDTDRQAFIPQIKRRYQIVVAAEDVPFSKGNGRPRIVKLHGSLRAGSRLIVSEEDYRSYPSNFAPFVNTVQQSMLENVFCLLGFSGDDPNFLAWTGWVRDRLGDKTPSIYLITLKSVPEGQRLTLERRNIFPIDISELGLSDGKVDYAAALHSLLEFWKDSSPRRRADWPYYRPVDAIKRPKTEVNNLVHWLAGMSKNRSDYPGWLVAPYDNRVRLNKVSGLAAAMNALRQTSDSLPDSFKLAYLYEISWACEESLTPLTEYTASQISSVLRKFSPEVSRSEIEVAQYRKPQDSEMLHMWASLVVAMLRDSRERSDAEEFEEWRKFYASSPLAAKCNADAHRAVLHEEILHNLEQRKRSDAFQLLKELLAVEGAGDFFWPVRIGALYAELGKLEKGKELIRTGLHAIREAIQFEGESSSLISREQWAERLLDALNVSIELWPPEARRTIRRTPKHKEHEGLFIEELEQEEDVAPKKTGEQDIFRDKSGRDNIEHPNMQIEILQREIDLAVSYFPDIDDDDGTTPEVPNSSVTTALSFCRLIDKAAFAPRLGNVGYSGSHLVGCYRILSEAHGIRRFLRILFRANDSESMQYLRLGSIANIAKFDSRKLFDQSLSELRILSNIDVQKLEHSNITSLKISLEIASKAVSRLDVEDARTFFECALNLAKLPIIREDATVEHIFDQSIERSLRLLPNHQALDALLTLTKLNNASAISDSKTFWPDFYVFDMKPSATQRIEWAVAIDESLALADACASVDDFRGHVQPLNWMFRSGLMSTAQTTRLSNLIWKWSENDELPNIPGHYRAMTLLWPSPPEARVSEKFRKWMSTQSIPPLLKPRSEKIGQGYSIIGRPEIFLIEILLSGSRASFFEWNKSDLLEIVKKLQSWWASESSYLVTTAIEDGPQQSIAESRLSNRLYLISDFIQYIVTPKFSITDAEHAEIANWLADLWEASVQIGTPTIPLLFACLAWWPERSPAVVEMTISVLNAHNRRAVVRGALNGAGRWMLRTAAGTPAANRYASHLVDSIRLRPTSLLELHLTNISELLDAGAAQHFEPFVEVLCASIGQLLANSQNTTKAKHPTGAGDVLSRVAATACLVSLGNAIPRAKKRVEFQWAMERAGNDNLLNVRKLTKPL